MRNMTGKGLSGLLVLLLSSAVLFGCNHASSDPSSPATGTSPSTNPTPGNTTTPTPAPTPTPTPAPVPSSDATVSNIVISPGNLDQVVQTSQTSYTATVGYFLTSVNATVTLSNSNASLDIDGSSVSSGTSITIPLVVGSNSVSAHVVAEDGTTSQTYTVTVTRQTLADLAQQASLIASNAENGDNFGASVAISGNTLVVGAPGESGDASSTASNPNNNAGGAGAVYVFTHDSGGWTQQAYLKASNAGSGDHFGSSVAISGNTLVVGAYGEAGDASSSASNPNDAALGAGAAYVFVLSNGLWSQQAYLKPSNADPGDAFGTAVAIDGDTVVVGANNESGDVSSTASNPNNNASGAGAAYVFTRSNAVWNQQAYLKAANADAHYYFGYSVSLQGDTLAVGSYYEFGDANSTVSNLNTNAIGAGAAYVFTRSNGAWTQQAYLKASNAQSGDYFGSSVSLDGNSLAVGAYQESGDANSTASTPNTNASSAGAVYVFMNNNGTWTQQAYLKASNATSGDNFGANVDMKGDSLIVGSPVASEIYVFTRSNGVWSQGNLLNVANTGQPSSGQAIALDGEELLVGSSGSETGMILR